MRQSLDGGGFFYFGEPLLNQKQGGRKTQTILNCASRNLSMVMDKTFVEVPFNNISLLFRVPVSKIFSWCPAQ